MYLCEIYSSKIRLGRDNGGKMESIESYNQYMQYEKNRFLLQNLSGKQLIPVPLILSKFKNWKVSGLIRRV